jgi:hypothetical protein
MNGNRQLNSPLQPQAATPAWSLHWLSVILAAAPLVALYFWIGRWELALALGVGALLWGLSPARWQWPSSLALALLGPAAAMGAWLGAPLWALVGLVSALSGWDLERFARQVTWANRVQDLQRHVRQHLLRLAAIDALALALGWSALNVRIDLNFGAALALALLVVLGLAQGIRHLMQVTRRE